MIIIASDYDGTLNHNGISEGDKAAIKKFREAGNKFGIVTGRDLEMAMWVFHDFEKVGLEVDFLICCTGGIILTSGCEIVSAKKQKMTSEHFVALVFENEELFYQMTNDILHSPYLCQLAI
jgi:HAD superfamily hydrolase (TIGR01484 family)